MKYMKSKKQNAINVPKMIPSLLFFAEIFPINVFNPGTTLAAPCILLLILASVSRCSPKLSFTAYA